MLDDIEKNTNNVHRATINQYKKDIFLKFVEFMALPDPEKFEYMGIAIDPKTGKYPGRVPTQKQFALKSGVSNSTLSVWKASPEFQYLVDLKRKQWGTDKIPNVLAALYTRCLKYGMAYDIETYLAYYVGWTRTQVVKNVQDKFAADDLRSIIAQLPADKQKEAYAKIADIIGDAELERSNSQRTGRISNGHSDNPTEVRG